MFIQNDLLLTKYFVKLYTVAMRNFDNNKFGPLRKDNTNLAHANKNTCLITYDFTTVLAVLDNLVK